LQNDPFDRIQQLIDKCTADKKSQLPIDYQKALAQEKTIDESNCHSCVIL